MHVFICPADLPAFPSLRWPVARLIGGDDGQQTAANQSPACRGRESSKCVYVKMFIVGTFHEAVHILEEITLKSSG